MKKVIRTIAAAALLFSMTIVRANEPIVVLEGNEKKVILEWDTQAHETFISLADAEGNSIYSEHVTKVATYAKKLNLSTLAKGNYYLTIENALRQIDYTIVIEGKDIKIIERKENTKPVFRTKNDKVFLNLLNLGKEKVSIAVLDSANRVVFTESIKNETLIQKAFNFAEAHADTYTIRVNDGTETYYENIVVK